MTQEKVSVSWKHRNPFLRSDMLKWKNQRTVQRAYNNYLAQAWAALPPAPGPGRPGNAAAARNPAGLPHGPGLVAHLASRGPRRGENLRYLT